MNHFHYFRIISMTFVILSTSSCSRFESEISLGQYRITYEVETEYGDWFGTYLSSSGEVCVCEESYQSSGWTHTFSSNQIPGNIFVEASSEYYEDTTRTDIPDITASIYVNGELIDRRVNYIADGKTRSTVNASEIPSF